jgi:hypothetical protein
VPKRPESVVEAAREVRQVVRQYSRQLWLVIGFACRAAERLARDLAVRAIVGRERMDLPAVSTSQMGQFETEWLATNANFDALTALSGTWIDRVHKRRLLDGIIKDMDSLESRTHGGICQVDDSDVGRASGSRCSRSDAHCLAPSRKGLRL